MKCPGQDMMFWKPGDVYDARCPKCGSSVEFFKDDTARKCGSCGHRFANPKMDFGCASYCPYADQCLGDLPPELLAQRQDLLKDRVAVELKRHLKADFKRIGRASRTARHAETIGKREGGNLAMVLPAAYLHVLVAEPSDDVFETVRVVLTRAGATPVLTDEVADLLRRIAEVDADAPLNLKIVADAVALCRMEEKLKDNASGMEGAEAIGSLLTETGRESAWTLLGAKRSNS